MRYADPSANRDLLGNRTLLFIFICAFALVTLLQQILYGSNYIKRGLQFGWQSGDQLANWTGLFNVTDDQAVQSGSDSSSRYFEFYEGPFEYNSTRCLELRHEILEVKVLSMVKQSELFDRWKSLQMCKWALNISEANQFKSTLSRCCNAPAFLFTTQKNTPLGTKLKYEVDTSGIYHINQEIFRMFPKDMPYYRSQFKKCAVVGNGGILKNSRCGREINSADFVFRWAALSLLQVQPAPHLREVHHGCGGEDGCGHCEPQHHHREVPQAGEVAAALLPRAAGVRERVGAAARLLQHAQHRRVHPRQERSCRNLQYLLSLHLGPLTCRPVLPRSARSMLTVAS
ncbi:alpha-2,8-sialyltransferase 8E isoform X7 [Cynocephalus volans]|uniref:alpha-2,8-sialyltransferase 8E isoform X7 n=1 Tax=Cynocephalus volans TaxID=110931 RepID=UPI002FCA7681